MYRGTMYTTLHHTTPDYTHSTTALQHYIAVGAGGAVGYQPLTDASVRCWNPLPRLGVHISRFSNSNSLLAKYLLDASLANLVNNSQL